MRRVEMAVLFVAAAAVARAVAPGTAGAAADRDLGPVLAYRSLAQHLGALVAVDAGFDSFRTRDDIGAHMRLEYDGLEPLLGAPLRQQFLGFSTDELRTEWLRRYWKLRDPTPTTAANERYDEHVRRLTHAREQHATAKPPYIDDAGMFYVKFGPPAAIREESGDIRLGVGYVPARQWWSYPQLGFEAIFDQPVPKGPWLHGDHRIKVTTRPDLVLKDTEFASGFRADSDRPRLDELAPHPRRPGLAGGQTTPTAITSEAFTAAVVDHFALPGETGTPLQCVFDVDAFRGPPGTTRVEVHLQTALRDLRFAWAESLYVARYRVEGVLLDDAVFDAAYDAYDDLVRTTTFRTTNADVLWPGQLCFDVPAGRYRLAVWIRDTGSGDVGRVHADLAVPGLAGGELQLSDLELASWIGPDAGTWSPRFRKQERVVIPNPAGRYAPPNLFLAYFEMYGLRLDAHGRSRYEVRYAIRPRATDPTSGWFPNAGRAAVPSVTASFRGEGARADLHETLRIDIASLNPGTHDLEVTVRDLVAGTEATTRTRFARAD